jgi:hypothetical protein
LHRYPLLFPAAALPWSTLVHFTRSMGHGQAIPTL